MQCVTEKLSSIAIHGFYINCCPVQPSTTLFIVLGGTLVAASAGGCGLLLQEDYSHVQQMKG